MVRDNNVDQALRVLKKKMQRKGVFREMKRRRFYEKPSETFGPGAGRSAAGGAQARSARQEVANRQTVRTQWTVLGHGPAPGSHVGVVGLAS
jgi:small subunit ribosomal protein S21